MTTFTVTSTIIESDISTIEEALNMLIDECNIELKDGPKAPYWAKKHISKEILSELDWIKRESEIFKPSTAHTILLREYKISTLHEAFSLLIAKCDQNLKKGLNEPYLAKKILIQHIESKFNGDWVQSSGFHPGNLKSLK